MATRADRTLTDRVWPYVGAALLVAAVVLPLLRQRGTHSWDTLWAEDGSVFAGEAINDGGLAVLLRGYNGYVQLPPRLLASVAGLVPLDELALYFAVAAVTVTALLAWFVYLASASWVHSRWVRVALASLIVLMPAMGEENTANLTNTIWAFAAAAPWALVSVPERRRQTVAGCVVAALAPASTLLGILFLPLAIGQAIVRRTPEAKLVVGSFMVGLAFQGLISLTTTETSRPPASSQVEMLVDLTVTRVFGVYLLGVEWTSELWQHHEQLLLFGLPLVTVAILAVLLPGVGRGAQAVSLVFAGYAVVCFVAPIWGRGTSLFISASPEVGALRYSVIPVFLLASAVAVAAAPDGDAADRVRSRVARPLFVVQIAVLGVAGFAVTNARSEMAPWRDNLASTYEETCGGTPSSELVVVPGVPGEQLQTTCERLAP